MPRTSLGVQMYMPWKAPALTWSRISCAREIGSVCKRKELALLRPWGFYPVFCAQWTWCFPLPLCSAAAFVTRGFTLQIFFFLSPITFLDRMSAVKLPPMGITSCREPSWCVYRNHSDRVILVRVLQDFMVCNAGFPIELLQVPPCKGSGFISCADRVSSYPLICIKSS